MEEAGRWKVISESISGGRVGRVGGDICGYVRWVFWWMGREGRGTCLGHFCELLDLEAGYLALCVYCWRR